MPEPHTSLKELTLRGVVLGALITLVFTASNVYLGLKVGLTFASSIPAAVISMAVLRATVEEFAEPSFDALMRALLIEVQGDEELAREMEARLTKPLSEATITRIDSAREAGQIDPSIDSSALAELIYGPILRRWLLGTGELDSEFADAVAGMAARAASPG